MSIGPKLTLKTSQQLALSPQMLLAIQILQCSNAELEVLIEEECEKNPLLQQESGASSEENSRADEAPAEEALPPMEADDDLNLGGLTTSSEGTEVTLDVAAEDWDPDADFIGSTASASKPSEGGALTSLESTVAAPEDLYAHLLEELQILPMGPEEAALAESLIHHLDPAGYFSESAEGLAEMLDAELWQVEEAIEIIQSLTPTGVGARSLAECLMLQLREKNRLDPMMAACLAHLDLVAAFDLRGLKKQGIRASEDDLRSVLADLRKLDPKPGLRFEAPSREALRPDILVTYSAARGWTVMLNPEVLPKVLVNRSYYSELSSLAGKGEARTFLNSSLQNANWLMKALDQRSQTLLRVASEVVKHQIDFLHQGVTALRPLTLQSVAETLELHESTISRAVANKTMLTPRGTFELRFFFTHAVGAGAEEGGEGYTASSIKAQVKDMIDGEDPKKPLSDEKLVAMLAENEIVVARRTVAKYREAMHIPSSSARRKQKRSIA